METMLPEGPVAQNPTAYVFRVGDGFKLIGSPKIPSNPVGVPSTCEPPAPAESGSWHRLIPPAQPGGIYIRAQWIPATQLWIPPLESQGRRVGFSSTYLAAYGWIYGEAD